MAALRAVQEEKLPKSADDEAARFLSHAFTVLKQLRLQPATPRVEGGNRRVPRVAHRGIFDIF